MTSKRKLEEKIAESKDPVIRKQLQELLELRNKRSNQRKDKVVNFVKEVTTFPPDTRTKEEKKRETLIGVAIGIVIIVVFIIVMIIIL